MDYQRCVEEAKRHTSQRSGKDNRVWSVKLFLDFLSLGEEIDSGYHGRFNIGKGLRPSSGSQGEPQKIQKTYGRAEPSAHQAASREPYYSDPTGPLPFVLHFHVELSQRLKGRGGKLFETNSNGFGPRTCHVRVATQSFGLIERNEDRCAGCRMPAQL